MNEKTIDFSILERLRADERNRIIDRMRNGAAHNTQPTAAETHGERTENEQPEILTAPRNIYALSERQETYIRNTKADIIERLYTGDDTAETILKAVGVMAICINDKAYYTQVERIINNVWRDALGKVKNAEELPKDFILNGIKTDYETITSRIDEGTLTAAALEDAEKARAAMLKKGQQLYATLPEASRASYELFKPPEPTPPTGDASPWDV